MVQYILSIALLVVFSDIAFGQNFCAKIEFNKTTYPEFRECQGKYLPAFVIKDYASNREIKPNRPTSRYFLTNKFDIYNCAESNMKLTFNANTSIEAAIYLKSVEKAFLEIIIYDAARNIRVDSLRSDGTNGWSVLKGNIKTNIPNARIEIFAYMTSKSVLAMEYLHILNSAIKRPECSNQPIKPPTTVKPPASTTKTPAVPAKSNDAWWWVIISLCLAALLIVITLVSVYCILDLRRRRSHDCTSK